MQSPPLLGDNREVAPEGVADRVLMGYVGTTHEFLPTAFRVLKDTGIIHYHEVCPLDLLPDRPLQRVKEAAAEFGGITVQDMSLVKVKSYGPKTVHVVVDAKIEKKS